MDAEDYISEMQDQLTAKTSSGDPFYVPANKLDLKLQTKRIQELVEVGHVNGFISDNDLKAMA